MPHFLNLHFKWILIGITLLRILMAAYFPITADEAYFWQWGRYPDVAYYDHPFMTGLWVHVAQWFGDSIFFPRALGILSQLLLVYFMYKHLQFWTSKTQAQLVLLAFLLSPVHYLFFLFSTDTPLFFFSTLAILCFGLGFKKERVHYFILAGAFLGLALSSKFLVFFIASALTITLLFNKTKKNIILYGISLLAGIIPFLFLNFYLSKDLCWWPLQFNIFNRSKEKSFDIQNFVAFASQQLFLLTPWVLWFIFKYRKKLTGLLKVNNLYFASYILALIIMGSLSFYATGLHWGLSVYPLVYLFIWVFEADSLRKIVLLSGVLSSVLTLILVGLVIAIPYFYKDGRYYADYVMGVHGAQLHKKLIQEHASSNIILGTMGYTTGALMEYHSKQHYIVFKDIDTNGRNDDLWTDYSQLDKKDFVLVSTYNYRPFEVSEFSKYFEQVEYSQVELHKARFYVAKGLGFKFSEYRDHYLMKTKNQFYQFKNYLPAGQCFFNSRYF